jgi:hypothetical protein
VNVASTRSSSSGRRAARAFAVALLFMLWSTGVWSSSAQAAPALNFTSFSAGALNADGSPSTQAAAHPFELVTSFTFGTVFDKRVGYQVPAAGIKDTVVALPAGVVGDPSAVPQCHQDEMDNPQARCPASTQAGYADVDVQFIGGRRVDRVPVYNMLPPPGEPAQFAFVVTASTAHVDLKVRSDGDYGVTATVHNSNAGVPVYAAAVHLWGVPADSSHDALRFRPIVGFPGDASGNPLASGLPRKAFLRNPTSCTGPLTTTVHATSWEEPDELVSAISAAPALTGCASVPFAPTLTLSPDTKQAGSPSGVAIDLNLPQNENPDGLATADLKRAVVTLPAGVAINPSAGDGLEGCTDAQFELHSSQAPACPNAANIGTTKVTSPLLSKPLEGSAYLAAPLEQGPVAAAAGRMFRVFLELHGSGVQVKLAGSVVPDPVTGQLVATFDNNPQLPFTNFHMSFNGGARAPLSLPKACGTYTTHSVFTSWATENPVSSDSAFTIDQNCDQAGRFEPSLSAGVTSPFAGSSSPFTMTFSRPDAQQDVSSLELTLPPGLVGKLAGVPLCPAAQAAAGTCSAESQIGKVTAATGAGSSPLWVPQAGRTPTAIYLSGPYKGAPFSLSVVVPAQAGPFDLGTVVVRAALYVDPNDAHVSVVSDPFPTILDGVPLNVQKINVTLDRPGFMLSPTNCTPMQISGTATSSAGARAPLTSRFQVGSCASLKFAPKFSVSTVGASSKANGASLTAKLSFPTNQGTQANITKVKVELPKQLPSRLTTLQKACTSAQFDANPAGCPPASFIGHATVHTPLLPVPLTGPAIFVSHGGEAFPSLVMVLQGYGVTVDLVGMTFINKAGVTSTTFKTVPDVPFNDFELTLPQGKFSALAANLPAKAKGSFCGQRMVMPSEFIAQNGARLTQNTPVTPTGCAKKASLSRAQKLAAALKACKKKAKGQRPGCARVARRQFGVVAKRARGR